MYYFEIVFTFLKNIWESKVEKILKGSLDLIQSPSPSVKIQIMERQNIAGHCQQTFENKKFVNIIQDVK